MTIKRRQLLKNAAYLSAAMAMPLGLSTACYRGQKQRVVIVGGGFSGATAARYLSLWAPDIDITLIEKNSQFISCPQSNLMLSGNRNLQQLTHEYVNLQADKAIRFIQSEVTAVDVDKRQLWLADDSRVDYDRLIIAPGVDFIYDQFPILATAEAQQHVPHAWKAGAQTELMANQLKSMRQGGLVIMTVPAAPFRCPPGPYERACQIALYLKNHNPSGKLLILDANPDIVSKKALFTEAWQQLYDGFIEYQPMNPVESVNVANLEVESFFESYKADVLNVIPPQRAGKVAAMAGVINIDNRWCDVDYLTYESTAVERVHVIGDAVAAKVPKSAHIANQQAKVCAAAVIALLRDELPEQQPVFSNTCYSFVDGQQAGHVAAVYRYDKDSRDMLPHPSGGVSESASEQEGLYAQGWAENIWADTLG
ncbi:MULTISPECIES: NAD(P)/FAD-dependent oxidoreductase [unclassified Methylophaga]|jgi:NADPH-dependent 2,4-dienoyl-CoA reductase/sulfur reductase-like enzyme|uniref:NAD(P)/FAD-dependent oxidoreductase n=1 Tax=unclassified Methylophaga TaxID=2629249 RepID=UPI000C8DAB01|nr:MULTISPECIES: NAD(P)/FAD-dependent oxidoreductase [unclassified Methylophaga]MAK66406.1 flavocytochrome C [Methylophaga sp.]MAY17100.1 flavocytochrome C [Methylophaga sp.]MBN46111.1 flavocytochrome C [Methylophaga sp.]|tara:strand:- start:71 stop:1342 length:1272 start_codon:yes stop_codon:yes gene_type:complete